MRAGRCWTIRGGRGWWLLAAAFTTAVIGVAAHQPMPAAANTWTPASDPCTFPPTNPTYQVPDGISYIQVSAIGGYGSQGVTVSSTNTGGSGGDGANVGAILPVSPGQILNVMVGHNGDPNDPYSGIPGAGSSNYGYGDSGGASVVTTASGDPCLGIGTPGGSGAPRSQVLIIAGGDAYASSSVDCNGGGGGGGTATAPGGGGAGTGGTC